MRRTALSYRWKQGMVRSKTAKDEFMMQSEPVGETAADIVLASASEVTDHIKKLLYNGDEPKVTPELAAVPDMNEIHHSIIQLRHQLGECAKGDFSANIKMRGVLAGMVKSLQANMRHLIWQMEQVRAGDLSQRVEFMGEFSTAFNNMVQQLDDALTALHHKEKQLTEITNELQREVEKRGVALAALQKSEENFKYLAEHDPLTGLPNRRAFFARAEVEVARNSIIGQHTSISVMDVDFFKKFNDTYGHLNGDEALRHIAAIGRSALRDNDIMARFGGEEFSFLFSKTNSEQGRRAAERIRETIEENPVVLDTGPVPITASFGVISIPPVASIAERDKLLNKAFSLADLALYEAKAAGRNRVHLTQFPPRA